jgi:hypothetical protein
MNPATSLRLFLGVFAVLVLAPLCPVLAFDSLHEDPDRQDPFNNCTLCHGSDLMGEGNAPSCFECHGQVWPDPVNLPPVVDPGGPYFGAPGQPIEFDASGTFDPDGDPLIYQWVFGDDSEPPFPSDEPTITHIYQAAGSYTAQLAVTDGINLPVLVDVPVEISDENLPPSADAGGPYFGIAGQPVEFDASGSSDPENDTLTFVWDFGDGTQSSPSQNPMVTHIYQVAGNYTAVLSVTDGFNDPVTANAAVEVIPPNLPPEVDPNGPYSGTVGQPVEFDGSGTSDPDGDPLLYEWEFGDGSTPSVSENPTTTHTYDVAGTYTAVLTVTDGFTDPVSAQVQVEISDDNGGAPPAKGDTWAVKVPFLFAEFTIRLQHLGPILLVKSTYPDGHVSLGIGMVFNRTIVWMDRSRALYMGSFDEKAGHAWGIVFGSRGRGSVWFAEQL